MTKYKDEALRLALEALETSMYPQQKQLQAITAIKAALEAKDEPVAWAWRAFDPDEGHDGKWGSWNISDYKPPRQQSRWFQVVPLPSTAPPQRKPLTEQKIGAILEDTNAFGTRLYTFARAIEAAHGIKEKNI